MEECDVNSLHLLGEGRKGKLPDKGKKVQRNSNTHMMKIHLKVKNNTPYGSKKRGAFGVRGGGNGSL